MPDNLPPNWSWVKLGDVCKILDNKRVPINSDERDKRISGKPIESLFPYYGATGQVGYIDDYLLDGEYVLLGEDGAPFLEKNKPKAYIVNGKIWVNNHAHILLSKNHNKFLCYYLNFIDYYPFVTGTTRLKLNQSSMKQIPIINPPLSEQKKIVEKIEELFSQLESGVASLKKAKEQIKLYRQSVLRFAFPRELIDDSKLKKITGSPIEWKYFKINEISENIVDCLHSTPKFTNEGKYCVDTTCIEQGQIIFNKIRFVSEKTYQERIRRLKPEQGDILFSREGTVGTALMVPEKIEICLGQRMMMFRLNKSILPKYFMYNLQAPQFISQYKPLIGGTTAPHLNIRDIKKFHIPVCSLAQQTQIVEEIEKRFSEADNLVKAIDESLVKADRLRQSILKKAFEGRLV